MAGKSRNVPAGSLTRDQKEIVRRISDCAELTKLKTKEIVQWTFDAIIDTLITDGRIELRNFGVFEVRRRKARRARNPRTKDRVTCPRRTWSRSSRARRWKSAWPGCQGLRTEAQEAEAGGEQQNEAGTGTDPGKGKGSSEGESQACCPEPRKSCRNHTVFPCMPRITICRPRVCRCRPRLMKRSRPRCRRITNQETGDEAALGRPRFI